MILFLAGALVITLSEPLSAHAEPIEPDQIAYTRTRPIAARVFEVTSTPPLDVLVRFTGCIDGLRAIE
jgi:hypothetical protein